jgi:hypothetical protein
MKPLRQLLRQLAALERLFEVRAGGRDVDRERTVVDLVADHLGERL